jgi:hypothetical protein
MEDRWDGPAAEEMTNARRRELLESLAKRFEDPDGFDWE